MPRNQSSSAAPVVAAVLAVVLLGIPLLLCAGWFVFGFFLWSAAPAPPPVTVPAPVAPAPVAPTPATSPPQTQVQPVEQSAPEVEADEAQPNADDSADE